MALDNWILFDKAQAETLTTIKPELAEYLVEITKSDLDAEVLESMRPMKGKFVLAHQFLTGFLTRTEFDLHSHEVVTVPDPEALSFVVAATGEWCTLVADSALLF